MAISKTDDLYFLECDMCGMEACEEFDSFQEAVEFKKDRSNLWKSNKENGEWMDLCPDCSGLGEEENDDD